MPMTNRRPSSPFFILPTFIALALFLPGSAKPTPPSAPLIVPLETGFMTPPDSIKPWCYWYWLSGNISAAGITKDLEAMARVGIGEAFIGDIGMGNAGNVRVLSAEWWSLVQHAIREGKRLGVDIGMFNSPGWSQSGGPWVRPSQAMRYLVFSETTVAGGSRITQKLAPPAPGAQDVAVIAFKRPVDDTQKVSTLNAVITLPETTIDITAATPLTARTLTLYPATPLKANVTLLAWQNGAFQTIKTFEYDRSNTAVNVGPIVNAPLNIAIGEVTSARFRIVMTGIQGDAGKTGLAEVQLSAAARLDHYIEKQLGKMYPTPLPLWNEYQWVTQAPAGTAAMRVDNQQVLDLTTSLQADGTLAWTAPQGEWIVMRFGAVPTGTTNSPAVPEATGLETDKMSREHITQHFNAYIGKIIADMPAADRTAFKHVVADSYEMGSQNYTDTFFEDFKKRYGYSAKPWLPTLSGRIVGSADQSDRFLWDLRRFVADRVAYDYVGGLRDLSAKHGLRVWLENYGHWGFPSEFLMYGGQSHDVAGEFWTEGSLGNIECRAASSAAHIYGMNRVSAESFTGAGNAFAMYPARLKKRGDWSFTEGINHVLLHVYIHQPYEEKNPGVNAWFGTEFNRKNTWFDQSKTWIDYLRRCMFMLQQGKAVNDVAYFIGEDAPKMTGIRDPELPRGYSYDYINAEVILNRLTVKDGRLVLPDGMSYRLLVLPRLQTMRPQLLKKIQELVNQGATIIGPRPERSPSLEGFPDADGEVQRIAAELWDGKKIAGVTDLQKALDKLGVPPDVEVPATSPLLWAHRRAENTDIYFLTNQSDEVITFDATFRVAGKQPEFWDATTGTHRALPQYTAAGNRTQVSLKLAAAQSCFIVFRTGAKPATGVNFAEPNTLSSITTPWQVKFNATAGGPEQTATFTTLTDWAAHTDERIRYYSGTAFYTNSFTLPALAKDQKVLIKLNDVRNMARIKINGKPVGGLWTAPWLLDISGAVTKGTNHLEIEVANTWVNRLIGDSRLPEAQRKTWVSQNSYTPGSALQPSGLIGGVSIVTVP
jgi:hypothetical protein